MPSFFANMKHKMPPVTADKRIEVKPFLLAAGELLPFLDMLGTMFKPVKNDVSGNINYIDVNYKKNPEKYVTLRDMLEDEKANGNPKVDGSSACSLLWLKRTLEYISLLMRQIGEDETKKESITEFVQNAYKQTLQQYHSWLVKQVFRAVAHAAPYRTDLLKSMGVSAETPEEEVVKDMLEYCNSISVSAAAVHELLVELELYSDVKA